VSLSTNLSSTAAGALIGGTLEITLEGKIVPTGILNNLDNYDNSSDRGGWADLTDRMLGLEKPRKKRNAPIKLEIKNLNDYFNGE
jgi:hypothetical protein